METKKVTTPINKVEVELRVWITGEEYETIMKPMSDINIEAEVIGKNIIKRGAKINVGDASKATTEIAIKTIVVSVGEEKKDMLEKIRAMHKDDYLFVVKEIEKIYSGEDFTGP